MSSPRRRSAWAGTVAGPLAAALLVATPALAAIAQDDQTQLVPVTPSAAHGWFEQAYDCTVDEPYTTPDQDYVLGPGTPTLGAGSHVMTLGQYFGQTELFRTANFDGTAVSDVDHLSYSTYSTFTKSTDTNDKQPAYLRLSLDTDNNGVADMTINYEPANNPSDGTVANDTWQNWDTTNGEWRYVDGAHADELATLQQVAATYPGATIQDNGGGGGVAMIVGCSGPSQENGKYGVDRFAISTPSYSKLFDFDPEVGTNTSNLTVTAGNLHGWNAAAYDDNGDVTPNQAFVFGPDTPPAGIGSRRLTLGADTADVVNIWRSPSLDGINVGDIRKLDYSTYEAPNAGNAALQQPAYLRLSIDADGDGSYDTTLNYEPANNSDVAAVANNTWQTWPTATGLFRVADSNLPGEMPVDTMLTLASFSAHYPKATVMTPQGAAGIGGLSLIAGCGGSPCASQQNADYYVDDVQERFFNGAGPQTDQTYDFEPTVPAPSINVPSVVTGRSNISITGNTNTNTAAPVALFEHDYGQSSYHQVATTTSADDGSYVFHRTVTKRTWFYVRSYDRTNSAHKAVNVRIKVTLTLTSPKKGKLSMTVRTSPQAVGETVRFYRLNSDGTHTLLATRTSGPHGGAHATIDYPSGHRLAVFATVTPPPGNLRGRSANERIRVS